mgnify:CR=1 FL=1
MVSYMTLMIAQDVAHVVYMDTGQNLIRSQQLTNLDTIFNIC